MNIPRLFSRAAFGRLGRIVACLGCLLFVTLPVTAQTPPVKPVIVFVHGAWAGGWQFKKVQALLEAQGYEVWRPTLTGLGERSHLATAATGLDTHIEDIVNLLRFENLTEITLVGHSYGGMVVAGVADRVPERIGRLIYLDALVPADGESVTSVFGASAALEKMTKDGFIIPMWVKANQPFPHDVPHPVKTMRDPLTLKNPAAGKIPTTYILTVEKGRAAEKDDFYAQSVRAAKHGWPVLLMEADHNPQSTVPEAMAKLITEIK